MKYYVSKSIVEGYNIINKDTLATVCKVPHKNPNMANHIAKLLSEDVETKRTVWILTKEYNAHDQYAEYFIAVYRDKPTHQQLTQQGVPTNRLRHVLDGGGRVEWEDEWYYLKLTECL